MIVNVFHNITEEHGRLAIYARYGAEPRIKPGDVLQFVGTLDFPDVDDVIQAANLAFAAGNSPADTEAVKEYRSWKVRSLSVGDVIVTEEGLVSDDRPVVLTHALGCQSTGIGWEAVNLTEFKLTGAVIVSLHIENTYELYEDVDTHVTDVVIPAPPADVDSKEYEEWAYDHINCYTGVGHTDGDSWYDVEITASSDPELVGRTFEWGY